MITKLKPGSLADAAKDQLGSLGKGIGQQVVQGTKDLKSDLGKQINPLENLEKQSNPDSGSHSAEASRDKQANDDLVREMYASSPQKEPVKQTLTPEEQLQMLNPFKKGEEKVVKNTPPQTVLEMIGIVPTRDPNSQKSPEDVQKMEVLKQQLHKQNYFDPVFNRPAPQRPEEQQKEQEREADKMKRLEQEDLQKKQKDEEKKKPIAVTREQNKTEMFRGSSG